MSQFYFSHASKASPSTSPLLTLIIGKVSRRPEIASGCNVLLLSRCQYYRGCSAALISHIQLLYACLVAATMLLPLKEQTVDAECQIVFSLSSHLLAFVRNPTYSWNFASILNFHSAARDFKLSRLLSASILLLTRSSMFFFCRVGNETGH